MAGRSLNKVQLIGNLTRDPELRFTPQGTAVCSFGLATNRSWTTDTGDKREETEFHRIVAWAKLAELCSQLLFKGRRVYVEGRLQTRQWTAQDGSPRSTTEVVIDDMIILDSKHESRGGYRGNDYGDDGGYGQDQDYGGGDNDQSGGSYATQGGDAQDDQSQTEDDGQAEEQAEDEGEEKAEPKTEKKTNNKKGKTTVASDKGEDNDMPF